MKLICKITFIILFLSNVSVKSQNKVSIEYNVLYDISTFSEEFRSKYPEIFEMYKQQKKREAELTFILNIDGEKSLFYHPPVNQNDQDLYLMYDKAEGKHVFFTDFKNDKIVEQFEYWNKKIEIETRLNEFPWKITNEKKKIQNYICYMATKQFTVFHSGKPYIVDVEAWYTEDIPLHFGPKDFSGLPGLILELRENNATYYVNKIDFKSDAVVKYPNFKGEKMTLSQFIENAPEIKEKAKQMIINSRG